MAFTTSRGRTRRALFGLAMGGACAGALAPIGCSSDSTVKKTPTRFNPDGGGDGGAAGESTTGGTTGVAGKGGTSGDAGASTGGDAGAGTGGTSGDAGASTGGDAGAGNAGAPNLCPDGYGDCDNNPADCETQLTLTTSCGACDVSCDGSHATVACSMGKCVVNACAANYGDCDNDGATGCETPIDTDTHCGDCSRNCAAAGSTCTTGKCAAITVLATGGSGYQSAQAGDSLYIMNTGSMPPGNYTTTRVPLNGSAPTKLTDNEAGGPGPGVLNADTQFIYWAIGGTPASVLKKSITAVPTDLNTVVFHPVAPVRFMTIVGGAYYWMTGATPWTIYTRATSAAATVTGTQIMSVDQSFVSSFKASTDRLYWVHRPASVASLMYVPFAGGTPTEVPDSVVADSAPLYTIGTTLYFVRNVGSAPENGIYKYTTGDATVTQLVQANSVTNLIADANAVYYTVGFDGLVYKAPLTGKNGVPIASGFPGVFGGEDNTFLYAYASWGSDGPMKKLLK